MEPISNYDRVLEFVRAFGQPIDEEFKPDLVELRLNLLREEVKEVEEEVLNEDGSPKAEISRAKLVKELCDVLYVTYGMAVTFGLPLDWAFREVHKSNMSKLGLDGKPIYRDDGKVLKGPRYRPPELQQADLL